ncbi:DNA-binding CsgD family transcriptional regulator [Kibdelosporangium banguiense]|uniref:DNA-binding CsgD family transcriptional regulator n=1 Tax=Kibdelosporangium banguiense TaxID=1365924 RepID=A0ABS4TKK4_9PSEU|nr:LuxR family transcriptional regulator [Kibdelosporangium banguiense]MBP2324949.1 DNA-binding CsgD family transcriptional regulator [Kibdelosporangium banguiense]
MRVGMTWPLLGRGQELALLESVLTDVIEGRAQVNGVALYGISGVGKTRLLRAALAWAAECGYTTQFIRATKATASVPLAAVSNLLVGDLPENGSQWAPFDLFHLANRRLRAWREKGPLIIAVDDAHLLDEASAALVHHVAASGTAAVLLTVRSGQRATDAIVALWKDELVQTFDVGALPNPVIDELVRRTLPGQVSGIAAARLRRLAEGNPLYLRELLHAGIQTGTLHDDTGIWEWSGSGGAWRLRELVLARVQAAGPDAQAVAELVACGEPVPLAMVEDQAGLTAAEQAGLVELVVDERRSDVRLCHPVYGEVLRDALPPIRARAVYRRLAEWLGKTPLRRRDDVLRLATWQVAAGLPADIRILIPAALQAAARQDLELAERLACRAAETKEPVAVTVLGHVLSFRGRHRDSAALLADGPPIGAAPTERGLWAVQQANTLYFALGRQDDAKGLLGTVLPEAPPNSGIGGLQPMMLLTESRLEEAIAYALPVLTSADELADSRIFAYTAAMTALTLMGRTDEALLLADEGEQLMTARRSEIRLGGTYFRIARYTTLLYKGKLAESRQLAEREYHNAASTGDSVAVALWAAHRGVLAQVRGDLRLAVTSLREAVALDDREDRHSFHSLHKMSLAGALAMTGDTVNAEQWLRQAEENAATIPRFYAAHAQTNRARVAAAGGDQRQAADLALQAADLARERGQLTQEAFALHEVVRHGAARRVSGRLTEVANRTDSDLAAVFADAAYARTRFTGALLDEVATSFSVLDAPLFAAETAIAAGHAYFAAGRVAQGAIAFERGRMFASECPDARTYGLVVNTSAASLTKRERQVAWLAATSMSSSTIAQRLGLSVRTVDNHLGRVYTKLEVPNRVELAKVLLPSTT